MGNTRCWEHTDTPDTFVSSLCGSFVAFSSRHRVRVVDGVSDIRAACLLAGLIGLTGSGRRDFCWFGSMIQIPYFVHSLLLFPVFRCNGKLISRARLLS